MTPQKLNEGGASAGHEGEEEDGDESNTSPPSLLKDGANKESSQSPSPSRKEKKRLKEKMKKQLKLQAAAEAAGL